MRVCFALMRILNLFSDGGGDEVVQTPHKVILKYSTKNIRQKITILLIFRL